MISLGLIPPGVDHLPPQRLRPLPHDGQETPEALAQQRPDAHGIMTLADGKTPIRIVTNGTPEPQPTKVHLFTTAPKITVRDRSVIFAGTYPPNITCPKTSKPPANYVRTPEIAAHLKGWTPLGRMVCTLRGDTAAIEANIAQNLMRYPRKTTFPTMHQLCTWPLDPRSMEIMNPENWCHAVSAKTEEMTMLLTTVATTAWLQTWGILMGRFLHQTGALRQTWPLLLRYHELACTLYDKARVWKSASTSGVHLFSAEVVASFPTYTRLNTTVPRPTVVTEDDMKTHRAEWLRFLVSHSFGDALFAWFYMNANIKAAFDICDDLRRKIHQFWCTRHWTMHELDTQPQPTPRDTKFISYAVIQGMSCPRIRMPKVAPNFGVFCVSHPVVRPGLPLFAIQALSLDAFSQSSIVDMYGARLFVEALAVVWDVSLCMTVADQRSLFRELFVPHGGGLFDSLLRAICRDVSDSAVVKHTKPPSALRKQMLRAGKERRRHVGMRNTSLAYVIGLPMSRRGPRDAGTVVHLVSKSALEHVSDHKPISFHGHSVLSGLSWTMGCSTSENASLTLERNSQSFFAPNHEVDLARFVVYLRPKLQSELYRKRLAAILRRSFVTECVNRHPQRKLDLGFAYFTICVHHNEPETQLCEYDIWAALLAFHRSGHQAQLPESFEALCAALPVFWPALNAHWHRYLNRVAVEVTQFLVSTLHATSDISLRRERFQTWQAAERYASQHRLDRFLSDSTESLELSRLISAFCLSDKTSRSTRWMLFFFLTHIQQPVPLDPAFFVQPTAEQDMELIRAVSGPAGPSVTPIVQLQAAVSHALTFGDVLWTSSVEEAWLVYRYSKKKPRASQDADVEEMLTLLLEAGKSGAFELALNQFVISRTVAVFTKVTTQLPTSCDDLREISDIELAQWLYEDETPDFTVFLRTETRADAAACEFVYRRVFAGKFQFAQVTRAHAGPLKCPGDTPAVWRPALPNWATRTIE